MAWAKGLRSRYAKIAKEPVPNSFRDLLEQIEDAESRKRRRSTAEPIQRMKYRRMLNPSPGDGLVQ
jgi:hypothetical protein